LFRKEKTGNAAIAAVNDFINDGRMNHKDLILNIIDKDLKTRMGVTLINDVYPGLIPTFEVALANSTRDAKVNLADGTFWASRKLDGIRCIAIVDAAGVATMISRQGIAFESLGKVEAAILEAGLTNCVLDGELCIMDENGNEDFQGAMKVIRKKDAQVERPVYNIFDFLTIEEFYAHKGTMPFSKRQNHLRMMLRPNETLRILDQTLITSMQRFEAMKAVVAEKGWEGLILRRDVGYEGKRSNNLLKEKAFFTEEFTVTDIETGPFRTVQSGREIEIQTLTAVTVLHKGFKVSVGSGFSLQERKDFFAKPSLIVGKKITVKYFEATKNQEGGVSLRFPTYKGIRENGE